MANIDEMGETNSDCVIANIWKGDWGLPSVDVDCLQLMTYLKFSGIDPQVKKTSNPFRSPKGKLPVFYCGDKVMTNFEEVSQHISMMNKNPDSDLSFAQRGEVVAYSNLLKEKMYPALLYVWWIDKKNHNSLTRPWYSRALPFPLNFYYPGKYLREAEDTVEALFEGITDTSDIETKLYSDAEKCMTSLSNRLGESNYMFGAKPSSFDALLYAYLAPLLSAPFPNKILQNYLNNCPNLRKFVLRISTQYYSNDYQEYEEKKREEAKQKQAENSEEFPHAKRNKVLAGLVAMVSMLIYAISSGIVKIPHKWKFWGRNDSLTIRLTLLWNWRMMRYPPVEYYNN